MHHLKNYSNSAIIYNNINSSANLHHRNQNNWNTITLNLGENYSTIYVSYQLKKTFQNHEKKTEWSRTNPKASTDIHRLQPIDHLQERINRKEAKAFILERPNSKAHKIENRVSEIDMHKPITGFRNWKNRYKQRFQTESGNWKQRYGAVNICIEIIFCYLRIQLQLRYL